MSDAEIIERVAQLWVECGGDAEGITWVWGKIRDRVEEILSEYDENL
jgi:hypothetical protein